MARLDLRLRCPGVRVYPGFRKAFEGMARALGLPATAVVELHLAGDRVMAALHRRLFGVGGTTDCIAIPTGFAELGHQGLVGAFYMGVQEVRRNAAAVGHRLDEEAAFVLAHGLLHLLGWDDATPAARARMFARQRRLVARLRKSGRLPRLLGFARGTP